MEDNYKNNSAIDYKMINNGIIGFAVGDALGVPVEFTSRDERKRAPISEMIGYGSHNVPEGTWSDDTSMSIAFMDSIIKCGEIDYNDIMQKFCNWYSNAEYTATDVLFDIGITTRNALLSYYYNKKPVLESGSRDLSSNGNGSLMRMLPVAMYLYSHNLSEDQEVEIVNNLSSLTHGHEISRLGCKIYCDYMKEILKGSSKEAAYAKIQNNNYGKYYSTDSISKYLRILKGNIKELSESEISSTGFVVSSLEASLWCTLNSNNYEEAVIKAVNLGDDTDTIGAITGGINGCIYGEDSIPDRWKSKLKKIKYLQYLATEFCNTLIKKNNEKNEMTM